MNAEIEISTDGKTVWVNAENGLIGRFSQRGIDVHNRENNACLACIPGPCDLNAWKRFRVNMYWHHEIFIDNKYMPEYLR
jgi:hypothetical protein